MKTKSEVAMEKFLAGYNCAQSVLYAYGPELGMDGETALKVATGLGAGMGRRGEVCGALTGGILVLGLEIRARRPAGPISHRGDLPEDAGVDGAV